MAAFADMGKVKEKKMLKAKPIELKAANDFVKSHHRHHPPVYRDKWRLGCVNEKGDLIGVIQAARPVSRFLDDGATIEIVRCCTNGDKNVSSFLLGRAYKIAKSMGYKKLISYILDEESGVSYLAAGWTKETNSKGGSWNCPSRPRSTLAPTCPKQRYSKNIV